MIDFCFGFYFCVHDLNSFSFLIFFCARENANLLSESVSHNRGGSSILFVSRGHRFPAREKVQTTVNRRLCHLCDVAPSFRLLLRCPVPLWGRPSSPPFSLARQTKAERSCGGTSATTSTAWLGFPLPNRTRLRWASIWFLENVVMAERRREVPPSLAFI